MIDLSPNHLETVERILAEHVPECEVRAFGSRVTWTAKDYSDLDLAVVGPRALGADTLRLLKEAFEESDLPFRVDVIDWQRISPKFQKLIEKKYVTIQTLQEAKAIPEGWQSKALADAIDIISGGTPKTTVPEYWGGDIPWLSVADFNTGYRWVSGAAKSITERGLIESATAILNQGDIIISARGTVGVVAQLVIPMAFNQSCYGIRGKRGVAETDFVYYALRYAISEMKQVAHGGVFDTVTRDTFKIIELNLPPLFQQRAIAHVLGALDDKIELNRRMNDTLESIARAIFKSWFVDFDPVRAKADGRQPVGMDAETAALFPDSFEDSELGKIPKDWKLGFLGDIADNPRTSVQASDLTSGVPHIALHYMPRRSIALSEWGGAGDVQSNKSAFAKGDLLFGKLRPYFHKVGVAPVDGVCSTDILVIRPTEAEFNGIVLMTISSDDFVAYTDMSSTGTKMPRTNWSDMSRYQVTIPPPVIAAAFNSLIHPFIAKIQDNVLLSVTLAGMRDTLLPKLISGGLRLKDAEKFLGDIP